MPIDVNKLPAFTYDRTPYLNEDGSLSTMKYLVTLVQSPEAYQYLAQNHKPGYAERTIEGLLHTLQTTNLEGFAITKTFFVNGLLYLLGTSPKGLESRIVIFPNGVTKDKNVLASAFEFMSDVRLIGIPLSVQVESATVLDERGFAVSPKNIFGTARYLVALNILQSNPYSLMIMQAPKDSAISVQVSQLRDGFAGHNFVIIDPNPNTPVAPLLEELRQVFNDRARVKDSKSFGTIDSSDAEVLQNIRLASQDLANRHDTAIHFYEQWYTPILAEDET